jgi:replicative DNA helicase
MNSDDIDVISFLIDNPDFYFMVSSDLSPQDFENKSCAILFDVMNAVWKKYKSLPTRNILKQIIGKKLKTTHEYGMIEEIYKIINHRLDPRDMPFVRDNIKSYVQSKMYGKLYSEEYMQDHIDGKYDNINKIIEDARKLNYTDTNYVNFYEILESLFVQEKVEHLTSGFVDLDEFLNHGGPLRGELLTFLAPTGKGKSMFMANSSVMLVRRGFNVLHVSMEMKNKENAIRYLGVFTERDIDERFHNSDVFRSIIRKDKEDPKQGTLYLADYPADAISVDTISALIRNLEISKNWRPDAIVIDYLELMISRVAAYNSSGNDYSKQKQIATELFGLANRENVLIITANQTNREGYKGINEDAKIGLGHQAESFGKSMPMNYIISINQSKAQYEASPPIAELYIAKNRNGPAGKSITVRIDYRSFKIYPYKI